MEQIAIGAALVLVPEVLVAGGLLWRWRWRRRRDTVEFVLRLRELQEKKQAKWQ